MINCFIHLIYWGLGIVLWWFFKDWDNGIVQSWLYNYSVLTWILLFLLPLSWLCRHITCTFFPFVSRYTTIVNDVFASYDLSVVLLLSTQPIADDVLAVGLTRKAVYYLVSCNICALRRLSGWLRRLWTWCPLGCIRFVASPRWGKTIRLLCTDPIAVSSMCLFLDYKCVTRVLFYLFKSEHMPLLMMWWWLWGAFNIPEHVFVPLLFCVFVGWTYVNADDAANKYLYLKYTMWFFSNMDGLRQAVMIITLLCFFFFVIASEVFIYVKPENIYMPLIFCIFFLHMSVPMLPNTKYLLLSYTIWEYAVMIITVCVLWSFYSWASSYVFMDIAFYTSAAVVVSSAWQR